MLRELSYKDLEIEKEINNLIGKEFNLLEKLKRCGTGSRQLIIKKSDNNIYDILSKSYELNRCNIEIREKGIMIYFRSRQSTYGLSIPFYKLVIFKVDNNHYTLTYDEYYLKVRIETSSDHIFLKKVLNEKAQYLNE